MAVANSQTLENAYYLPDMAHTGACTYAAHFFFVKLYARSRIVFYSDELFIPRTSLVVDFFFLCECFVARRKKKIKQVAELI